MFNASPVPDFYITYWNLFFFITTIVIVVKYIFNNQLLST